MAFSTTIATSRPRKLDSAIAAPSGTPRTAASSTAEKLTAMERRTIANSAGSPVKTRSSAERCSGIARLLAEPMARVNLSHDACNRVALVSPTEERGKRHEALEASSRGLDLGRLGRGRSARPPQPHHAQEGAGGHRRGEGRPLVLPQPAARFPGRQRAERAAPAA